MDSGTFADLKSRFEQMNRSQTSGLANSFNDNEDNKQNSRKFSHSNPMIVNQQPKKHLQKGPAAALSSRESSECSTDAESDDPLNKDGYKQSLRPKPVPSFTKPTKVSKISFDDNSDPFDDSQEIDPFTDDNDICEMISSEPLPLDKSSRHGRSTHTANATPNKPPRKPVKDQSSTYNSKNPHRYTEDDDSDYKPPLPSRPPSQKINKSTPPPLPPNRIPLTHSTDGNSSNKVRRKTSNLKIKTSRSSSDPTLIDPILSDTQSEDERPDLIRANRRPPSLKGLREITSKSTTRAFAISGDIVITDSGHTRVWSLTSGENTNIMSHDDSKVTCLCWRPAKRMEDIGRYIWCGGHDGHLFAIDVCSEDKYFEMTRKAHSVAVNFILRYGLQLWTLDVGGKLLIWSEGDDGVVSLKSTPQPFTIAPNQTCAIIVGHHLWTAAENNIEIFNPLDKSELNVKKIDIKKMDIGNITCMTQTSNTSLVYIGHEDGRITVWNVKSYKRVALVHASNYCITSLLGVNDYLWAGFKTGMIYIYDVTKRPWITIKDWHAHKSPIVDMQLDEDGLWRVDRLQVASCSSEGVVIAWDGLMQQDWIADQMSLREKTYCNYRDIKILLCSWNIGACKPNDLDKSSDGIKFMRLWLTSTESPDIIFIGFQEIFDLKSKKMNAKTLLTSKKKLQTRVEENLEKRSQEWREKLIKMVAHTSKDEYEVFSTGNLFGLFSCFFVKKTEKECIRDVHTTMEKTGLKGLNGNKGSIATRFIYDDSSMCFVNCHLAAGQKETLARNKDIANILENTTFPVCFREAWNDYENVFTHGGDGTMVFDHENCFLSGDLNYRIDMQRELVLKAIAKKNYDSLSEHDQLIKQRQKNPSFRLRSFSEGELKFAPTYKYNLGEDEYDTSEKRRTPAWCDRILYRGPRIKQERYERHECKVSDHRPISSAFKLSIKAINRAKQLDVKEDVAKAWNDTVRKEKSKIIAKWLQRCGFEYDLVVKVLKEEHGNPRKTLDVLNKNYGKSSIGKGRRKK